MKKKLIIIIKLTLTLIVNAKIAQNDTNKISFNTLPFAFYSNSLGWVLGTFSSIKGYPQKNSFAKTGVLISTNGSRYLYFQADEIQNPLFKRQFIRPDFFVGKLGNVKEYIGPPVNGIIPGSNSSKENQFLLLHGNDYWFELNFKHLLPIGKGESENLEYLIDIKENDLVSENIFDLGKFYFETKLIYRNMDLKNDIIKTKIVASAIDISVSNDNTNYIYFPTYGTYQKLSYIKQIKAFGCDVPADIWKVDLRFFYPLFDYYLSSYPTILSLNFITMDTPSWNLKYKGKNQRGKLFIGPTLGGTKYLRGYKDLRYHDRAMLYYSLELRKSLDWNPFRYYDLTRKIGIELLQLALFCDFGRVSEKWQLDEFHKKMQYTYGIGIRALMNGMVLRMDAGKSRENFMIQMFVENPF